MNYKELAEKRIRELVPELQKLEFGCELRMYQRVMKFINITSYEDGTHLLNYLAPNGSHHNGNYTTPEIEALETLGKPIELQHVLLAIQNTSAIVRIYSEGLKFERYGESCMYNLSLPFTEQSEEVHKFIYELIK